MIISASRRTDIPAYYSEWFLNRLKAGYVLTRNPMNPAQVSRILLTPEVIDCIVFWTKDPLPMMDKLPILDAMGYSYYFQFTLTPYGGDLERNLRDKEDILKTFLALSKAIGKEKVLWRYDPIILNDTLTLDYHLERFATLCKRLSHYTETCTISFVDLYAKLKKSITKNLLRDIREEEMLQLAEGFSGIGKEYGIKLFACSEKTDFREQGIYPASCIDKNTVERVCGYPLKVKADTNQRPGCGCIQSIDIGIYNTCSNGCVYCYANYSTASVEKQFCSHIPGSELLVGTVGEKERIMTRDIMSFRDNQYKFF